MYIIHPLRNELSVCARTIGAGLLANAVSLPRSLCQWMLGLVRRIPDLSCRAGMSVAMKGRMFKRTPSLKSGSQPTG